jgi:tetratricopeptide (TPR) repeat protein
MYKNSHSKSSTDVVSANLYAGQALFEKGTDFYDDALKHFFVAYRTIESMNVPTTVTNDPVGKGNDIQLLLSSVIESIGNAYRERGKHEEAISFFSDAVELLISKIGKESHEVARTYYVLAQTFSDQKDYDEALKALSTAKEIFSSIYGDRHPETAACYYKIGLVLREYPKRKVEALESLQEARDRWLKEFGAENAYVIEVEKQIVELERLFDSRAGALH